MAICLRPCIGGKDSRLIRGRDEHDSMNLSDRSINSFNRITTFNDDLVNIRVLTLSHNRIKFLPDEMQRLRQLERLNLYNNFISDISPIASLPRLRYLNVGMNNLAALPRSLPETLEVLDLSYNFLDQNSFPPEFWNLLNLKALYLSDNELEFVPSEMRNLQSLQILALRDNNLTAILADSAFFSRLRELLIENNFLQMLPPELGFFEIGSARHVLRIDGNPLNTELLDQLRLGISHLIQYIGTSHYHAHYARYIATNDPPVHKQNIERRNRKQLRLKGK